MADLDLRILPRTVQQQTVEKLRTAIITGLFKPGQKLVEAELCDLLGISRPSVREALRSLEAEKLLSIVPNRGPHVSIVTSEHATEIYNVRALLEGEAAALTAQKATAQDIKSMRASLTVFRKAVRASNMDEEVGSTTEFYDHMLRLCGNRIIKESLQGLLARINFLRTRSMSLPGRAKLSLKEMSAILDAIEKKDSKAARKAAVYHVEQAHLSAQKSYELDEPK